MRDMLVKLYGVNVSQSWSDDFAAQIREAQEEYGKEIMATHACYPEGFTAAKKKAVEIVEKEYWNVRAEEAEAEKRLADRIRQMEMK